MFSADTFSTRSPDVTRACKALDHDCIPRAGHRAHDPSSPRYYDHRVLRRDVSGQRGSGGTPGKGVLGCSVGSSMGRKQGLRVRRPKEVFQVSTPSRQLRRGAVRVQSKQSPQTQRGQRPWGEGWAGGQEADVGSRDAAPGASCC